MTKRILLLSIATLLSLALTHLQAQVTVGDGTPPQSFSMLEIVSNNTGGLRLPHLTTAQRNVLTGSADFQAQKHRGGTNPGLGLGLTIYNTDTNCTEYWNGYKWVSLCLGMADITLKSPCGNYDPATPPQENANGIHSGCVYTPEEMPACTVSSGKPFEVHLLIGATYATVDVDNITSAFTVQFLPNNSNMSRNAIVRVTSNCTGEHKDFVFTQKGGTCSGAPTPTINVNTNTLCAGGSVIAYITNAQTGVDYIWTFSGTAVHTGTGYTITRPGTYKVYAGLIGCGTPATITINDNSSSMAPRPVQISATNGGVICGGANVVLTANTTETVYWYHNGKIHNSNSNPLAVSGAAAAGEWFAVVKDAGGCMSNASNILNLIDNTTAGTALATPVATVNDNLLTGGSLTICKSGTLKLEVTNASDYSGDVEYEWLIGGATISRGSSPIYLYNVPDNIGSIVLSVIVSDRSGNCPNSATSADTQVTLSAPAATAINNGDLVAPICNGTSVVLMADITTGTAYEWFLDGDPTPIPGENSSSMTATTPGEYTMRYTDGAGCWSRLSPKITVVQSGQLNLTWNTTPTGKAIKGENVIYTVNSTISAPAYKWSYTLDDPAGEDPIASIAPVGDGSTAVVVYSTPTADDIKITLKVETEGHPCGDKELTQDVVVEDGCIRGTTISLVPKGTRKVVEGEEVNFAVSTDASDVQRQFIWFIDDVQVATTNTVEWKHTFSTMGTYKVTVQVVNKCTPQTDNVISQPTTVEVEFNMDNYIPDASGDYWITGKDCYDVGAGNINAWCGDRTTRGYGDFMDPPGTWNAENKEFEYEFKYSSYQSLSFTLEDNAKVVKSMRTDISLLYAKVFITFDESVLSKAKGLDRDNALKITLNAGFTSGGNKLKVSRVIRIQDCECGCGLINNAAGKWRRVACHNLGADTSADPFDHNSPMAQKGLLNGDYYQWGRKVVAGKYDDPESQVVGWNNAWYSSTWTDGTKSPEDPCPDGFRVPTKLEMEEFIKNNKTIIVKGNWSASATNFSAGVMWGTATGQYLYLPAAGYRNYVEGKLTYRGMQGRYWVSTQHGPAYDFKAFYFILSSSGLTPSTIDERFGFSVRCVSEQ